MLVAGSLLLGAAPAEAAGSPSDPARTSTPGVYVVTLSAPPAAVYGGAVRGLRATRPDHGARFDRTRAAVRDYRGWLVERQDRLLHRVGDPIVLYRYTTAIDGFAASLTSTQVRRLRAADGVLRVERSTKRHIDARSASSVGNRGLAALRRDAIGRAWARHGGPGRAGRGVVVGVVDSGVWPRNPSFTGLPDDTPGTARDLPGFHGGCATGEDWAAEDCTDKIVSARWFVKGFGEENTATSDFLSPRDGTGHGSHVASTAVGDHGVRVTIDGQRLGTISGMAPAGRLAVYKACWSAPDPSDDGCSTADTVAAIDAAVADGVDVLNYSVSGSDQRDDVVERAFLGAASAGVFVATSAGNRGAGAGTVRHLVPWVTTVAASTLHGFRGTVRLGDGRTLTGAMVSDATVRATRLVLGRSAHAVGVSPREARYCRAGSLDPSAVHGAVVVCDRGHGSRVAKSATVADAGGAGMLLANTRAGSTDADMHGVPTVHLDAADARVVRAYARGRSATAALLPGARGTRPAPAMAGFSSRGPAAGDVLKPDLTAPGVSVLGAVAPPSDSGRFWDLVSGTSTSAPHVAGLAAFVLGVHRGWSPARVKSAMMTSASDVSPAATPLGQGAGSADPASVLDPGLVFDTSAARWRRLADGSVRARDVNAASLALGDLVGPTTVTRRLTNVGSATESYAVRVVGLRGVDVQAFPATVRLAPGRSRTVRLRVTARPTATVDRAVTGWLVWRGDRHRVRMPVSVRPTVVAAPQQVDGSGHAGRVVVKGRSGNGRTLKLHSSGLVAAHSRPVTLQPQGSAPSGPPADPGTAAQHVQVPAGTDVARFATSSGSPGDDVGLYVYRDGVLVDSADGSPRAEVTLDDPHPGDYRVDLTAQSGDGAPTVGRLDTWVVPAHGGSPVELSTDAVGFAPGKKFHYSASWHDLDPARQYLGVVGYGDSDRRTLVQVGPR